MLRRLAICVLLITCSCCAIQAQGGDTTKTILPSPGKYIDAVASKAKSIENKLNKKSEKALAQLKKQEDKLLQQLQKLDSNAAKQMMEQTKARYAELQEKLKRPGKLTQYLPGLDSSSTALNFLNQNPQVKEVKDKLQDAIGKVDALKAQLQKAENIKQFLKERKEYLKEKLTAIMTNAKASPLRGGLEGALKKLNKTVYYYQQQIAEYKNILNDPKKIERKALEILSKQKFFKEFMRKNSMLALLFRLPGDPNDPAAQANLAGLQTRASVNVLIQNQISAGGPNAMQQFQSNLQNAQSKLNQLKDKVLKFGGGSSDAAMPEGFKPNIQRTKSFLQRLEYGANIQSQKATNYFPVTSDIGLSVGYKLNDKSIIGAGVSYKIGLGRGWDHIRFSSEGVGLRSFVDWRIKGSFWISGGYEQNYRTGFNSIAELRDKNAWQQSGLLGISKRISLKTKFFKQTSIKLLWDFLSYKAVPAAPPLLVRVGYNF